MPQIDLEPAATLRSIAEGSVLLGTEFALPTKILGNAELDLVYPNWRMAEVAKHTGVTERRIAAENETALDLGERASQQLLARLNINPGEIDALLFCTETPDHIMPPNACLLQHRLGLRKTIAALDYTLACSGFVYGLFLAHSMIVGGGLRTILLVTGDTYSKLIFPGDRGTRTLFGDAAAATIVQAGLSAIGPFDLGTDGSRAECFMVPAGGARMPRSPETSQIKEDRHGNENTLENIRMNGAQVLEFVKAEVPGSIEQLLHKAKMSMEDIDLFIFHQASKLSLQFLAKKLRVPDERMFSNISLRGNTVSAAIPLALREAELAGRLNPGMRCMLVGFGVGVSWASCIVEWR